MNELINLKINQFSTQYLTVKSRDTQNGAGSWKKSSRKSGEWKDCWILGSLLTPHWFAINTVGALRMQLGTFQKEITV